MNLLDQKLEAKIKLFEECDKRLSNYKPKINPLDISQSSNKQINISKDISNSYKKKIDKNNKFEDVYSNFNLDNNENAFYFRNYEEMMNYMYTLKNKVIKNPEKNKKFTSGKKSDKNNKDKNQVRLIPKKDNLIDRLLRYGENLEKKKERMKLENENNFKLMATPDISALAKNINRNPKKFVERLFYDKYTNEKKKYNKHDSYYYNNKVDEKKLKAKENNNFTHRPTISKKSQEIANKLEPSSKRLLKKKEKKELVDRDECEKLLYDNYKNLFINNNFYNKYENKKININEKNLIYKLYNKGLEKLRKKEMKFQEHLKKKNEEYKNYSFSPNVSVNKNSKSKGKIKNMKSNPKRKSIKYLNKKIYNKQVEWQKKIKQENSNKKLIQDNLYLRTYCTFKPKFYTRIMKENPQMIKKYLKTSNSYIERRRRQIKQEKERLNKSSDYKNNYGFSLKDFVSEQNNNYLYGDRVINTTSPYIRTKKGNEKGELILDLKRNNINAFIPPNSQRIFCYYDENGDFNNSVKYNNFSNVDISQISFIDAIKYSDIIINYNLF